MASCHREIYRRILCGDYLRIDLGVRPRAAYWLEAGWNSRTMAMYLRAVSVTTSGLPAAMARASMRSDPTPRAKAPAWRNSAAVARETPPVGTILICGRGPLRVARYLGPPRAPAGKTLTASGRASQPVTISVGVSAPGRTAIE